LNNWGQVAIAAKNWVLLGVRFSKDPVTYGVRKVILETMIR